LTKIIIQTLIIVLSVKFAESLVFTLNFLDGRPMTALNIQGTEHYVAALSPTFIDSKTRILDDNRRIAKRDPFNASIYK
jgi:hypothetical protein